MIHDRLTGLVIPGKGRGQRLGFPTANVQLSHGQIQPPTGIFAGLIHVSPAVPFRARPARGETGRTPEHYLAAIHIGPAPTFNDADYTIEVHLLDYAGDHLYGQRLTVELVKKIRDIKKFDSEEELKSAIAADCAEVRKFYTPGV